MKRLLLLLVVLPAAGAAQEVVWTRTFTDSSYGPEVSVDALGNVVVAAAPWVRKFSPDGESLWTRRFSRSCEPRWLLAATDREGGILLGYYADDTSWGVTKFTSTGDSVWSWRASWPVPSRYHLTAIASDSEGRALVSGYRSGTHESSWYTFRLSADGNTDWLRTFSSEWGPDQVGAVNADRSKGVLVGGCRGMQGRNRQWFPSFIRYSADGDSLGGAVFVPDPESSPGACLAGKGIAADSSDNILLAGSGTVYCDSSPLGDWNGTFLFKYDPVGEAEWRWFSCENDTAGYTWWTGEHHRAVSCRTDPAGKVVLLRPLYLPGDSTFVAELRQFGPEGVEEWVLPTLRSHLPQYPGSYTPALTLALSPQGDIVLAGRVLAQTDTAYVQKVARQPGVGESAAGPPAGRGNAATVICGTGWQSGAGDVYDASGKMVRRSWLSDGRGLVPGVYFVRHESAGYRQTHKLVIAR